MHLTLWCGYMAECTNSSQPELPRLFGKPHNARKQKSCSLELSLYTNGTTSNPAACFAFSTTHQKKGVRCALWTAARVVDGCLLNVSMSSEQSWSSLMRNVQSLCCQCSIIKPGKSCSYHHKCCFILGFTLFSLSSVGHGKNPCNPLWWHCSDWCRGTCSM